MHIVEPITPTGSNDICSRDRSGQFGFHNYGPIPCSVTGEASTHSGSGAVPQIHRLCTAKHDGISNYVSRHTRVLTQMNLMAWERKLKKDHDTQLLSFLTYGFPLEVGAEFSPNLHIKNHPTALQYADHVDQFLAKEIKFGAIMGPFKKYKNFMFRLNLHAY